MTSFYHVTYKTATGWGTAGPTIMSHKGMLKTVARLKREGWKEIRVNSNPV
jgi:hypothetical protein